MNNIIIATDGYKTEHHKMYPPKTELVVSNFTKRSFKYMPDEAKDSIEFGTKYTFMFIKDFFDKNFFNKPHDEAMLDIKETLSSYGQSDYDITHLSDLHKLGYLPIKVLALPEGTVLKQSGIPSLVYYNTKPEFYWVVNFLETLISVTLWKPMHSASMSYGFRKITKKFLEETCPEYRDFLDFQCHDFSFRGMQSIESAISSAIGFSVCSKGSDTLPALWANKYYYGTPESVFSVPASEHAVMTAYGKEDEIGAFTRILDLYPNGIVSLVSDSYDFWKIHTDTIYKLKDKILNRNGKTVFRGDSGNPVDIICGSFNSISSGNENDKDFRYPKYGVEENSPEYKGQIELLWDCFGGTINAQGYKVLNEKVGAIWGDGINFQNMQEILERLKAKGFASCNIVFGIGSFSMGYATRDNQGTACKATYCVVDGVGREIFKDPITDQGKKSAKGLLSVYKNEDGSFRLEDQSTWEKMHDCEFVEVFEDGVVVSDVILSEIRQLVNNELEKEFLELV